MSDHESAHADTPAEPGEWLSLPNAATRLRIHLRTVHAWINDGRLTKRKLPRRRTEVWVPDHMAADAPSESPQMSTQGTSLVTMSQHMMLLERQGEIAAQQMGPLVEQVNARDAIIREQAEEIGRLKAELAVARAPWWRRWFGE
jgi:hypothetical protein